MLLLTVHCIRTSSGHCFFLLLLQSLLLKSIAVSVSIRIASAYLDARRDADFFCARVFFINRRRRGGDFAPDRVFIKINLICNFMEAVGHGCQCMRWSMFGSWKN